jgi:hypothetical protein
MVYNPALYYAKKRLFAILTADLTPAQLDRVQELFGIGATMCSPSPAEELFISDRREWSDLSHAELKRAYLEADPLLVIDSRTPDDGGIWYLDRFADEDDIKDGQAESLNTLYKIRMDIRDVVIQYTNYSIANTDIREALDAVDVPYPTPDGFDQETLFCVGFDHIKERYMNPTWVTAMPDELEESTALEDISNFVPRPEIVYRVKENIARQAGLKSVWMIAVDTRKEVELPDGSKKTFPLGSKIIQSRYDPEASIPVYKRPNGSL